MPSELVPKRMAPFSIFSPHLPCQSRDLWCVQSSKRATRASSHGTRKLLVPPVQSPRMSSPRSMEFTAWQHGRHWGLPHHTPRMLFKFLLIHIVLFVLFFFLSKKTTSSLHSNLDLIGPLTSWRCLSQYHSVYSLCYAAMLMLC